MPRSGGESSIPFVGTRLKIGSGTGRQAWAFLPLVGVFVGWFQLILSFGVTPDGKGKIRTREAAR
jgi:hypothetical protein